MWSWFLVLLCKMMMSPGIFFIFSKCWKAKNGLKLGNFCLSHSISQKTYIMILISGTHVQNDSISKLFCHFLQVVWGIKWQKVVENEKNFVCCAPYLRNHTYDFHLWYTCVKWWHLSKILIFWGVVRSFFFGEGLGGC